MNPDLSPEQVKWLADLRSMVDFLEARPALIPLYSGQTVYHSADKDEFGSLIRLLGTGAKKDGGQYIGLERSFGQHSVHIFANRDNVCERVVVGTELVKEPDPAAVASLPLVEVEREIVEWQCPPSFLTLAEHEAEASRLMGAAWNDGPLQETAGPPSAGEGRRAGAPAGDTSSVDEPPTTSPAEPLLSAFSPALPDGLHEEDCETCAGTGYVYGDEECPDCEGIGTFLIEDES